MKVLYADRKLEKVCKSVKELTRRFGEVNGKIIGRRLEQLDASSSLAVLRTMPQVRCHELTGDRQGQLAVDAKHPQRIIFRPTDNPPARLPDGGLDWTSVTEVTIIEVVDYHGH